MQKIIYRDMISAEMKKRMHSASQSYQNLDIGFQCGCK